MARVIWKYNFEIKSYNNIEVPSGGRVLHTGLDPDGNLAIWIDVDPLNIKRPMVVYVVGTGDEVPNKIYAGSIVQGPFVWHIFYE
jgi:hypothetical protein